MHALPTKLRRVRERRLMQLLQVWLLQGESRLSLLPTAD